MIDMRDLLWKDNDSGQLHRITEFVKANDKDIVWYINVESLEEHCMDSDLFVEKYTATGVFDDFETA